MDITRKTSLQFVFFFSYSCYYMLIVIWFFYMGIKFLEDLFSWVFNFEIFVTITKNAKLKPHEIKYQKGS